MTTAPPAGRTAQTAAPTTSPGDVELETHGGALLNILRSGGEVAELARATLQTAGVVLQGTGDGLVVPDWFPLRANLSALGAVAHAFGDEALFQIGFSVRDHARFPPAIHDLPEALEGLDVAYHTNHRRNGVVMYDPATGRMLDGIGNYGFGRHAGGTLLVDSSSVYPCRFDLGVISGLAAHFDPRVTVTHPLGSTCRRRGATSCRYTVRPDG